MKKLCNLSKVTQLKHEVDYYKTHTFNRHKHQKAGWNIEEGKESEERSHANCRGKGCFSTVSTIHSNRFIRGPENVPSKLGVKGEAVHSYVGDNTLLIEHSLHTRTALHVGDIEAKNGVSSIQG